MNNSLRTHSKLLLLLLSIAVLALPHYTWADEDDDCQNSRMEALISLSTNKGHLATDKECRVVAGR